MVLDTWSAAAGKHLSERGHLAVSRLRRWASERILWFSWLSVWLGQGQCCWIPASLWCGCWMAAPTARRTNRSSSLGMRFAFAGSHAWSLQRQVLYKV